MMTIVYYLYYRLFALIKSISLKSSYSQGRVAFFFSLSTGSNFATILKLIGLNVISNNYLLIIFTIVWFLFCLKFFNNPERHQEILSRFNNETLHHKVLGGFGAVIYLLASLIIFIKVMAK
jgi:hypothetical protein